MFLLLKQRTHSSFFFIFLISSLHIAARTTTELAFSSVTKISFSDHDSQKLAQAIRGSHINGISSIKRYFSHFGYLPFQNESFTDIFDARFESAIIRYQKKLGLQVTGKLDFNTFYQIITPRCGVKDRIHSHSSLHLTKNYVYFPGRPRWNRRLPMRLTYAFSPENSIKNLSLQDIREAFKRAFSRWASVIPVSFVETDDYGFAEIKIGFYKGDHGDGEPFDGVLGVLAHSFSPESGRLHLDAEETWAVDFRSEKSEVAVDLESVATHEIGHVLGLSHSSVKEAVMYPSLKPRDKRADLNLDDIKGVQALYGSNPNFKFGSLLESDISANHAANLGVEFFELAGLILFSLVYSLTTCL